MKRIDQYRKAKRNKITNTCIVVSQDIAIQWLGCGSSHCCDESCVHLKTCISCIHYVASSDGSFGNPLTCRVLDK